jgi:hypothetical protein
MQATSSGLAERSGPPAFVLIAITIFLVSQLWSLPIQWLIARRLVREVAPARLAAHALGGILVSAIAGGVPLLLACGLLADAALALGMSEVWADRVFILVIHADGLQVVFLLGWLALAWITTSGVEALFLKRMWRSDAVARPVWSVAWRMNGATYLGMAALSIVLARNP